MGFFFVERPSLSLKLKNLPWVPSSKQVQKIFIKFINLKEELILADGDYNDVELPKKRVTMDARKVREIYEIEEEDEK